MLLPHPPLKLPSSSKSASIAALASPSRTKHHNLAEKQRSDRADQEQIWRDLLANPSLWWDNRYDKLGRGHPDFRHKISRQPLWLNSHRKPAWVDRETLDSFNHGLYSDNCSVFEDLVKKFHGFCRVGRLDMAIHMLFNMPFHPTENMYYALLKVLLKRDWFDLVFLGITLRFLGFWVSIWSSPWLNVVGLKMLSMCSIECHIERFSVGLLSFQDMYRMATMTWH